MSDVTLRHLLDLCRRNRKTGLWQYSAFLSPADQDELLKDPEAASYPFFLTGGKTPRQQSRTTASTALRRVGESGLKIRR